MPVKWQVRVILAVIFTAFLIISSRAYGEGWPTNYQHFNDIRELAKHTRSGTHVAFTLNDGTQVFGTLLKYESYNDYIWYQPQGTGHNWFKQDAFDVHEIFRLDVITEPV